MDGCLYATPHIAKHILRIDPFAGTVSTLDKEIPSSLQTKLVNGVVDTDGALWLTLCSPPERIVRVTPARPRTELLSTLLQSQHRDLLLEGLSDYRCYGPALVVEL